MTSVDLRPTLRAMPYGVAGPALVLTLATISARAAAMLGPGNLRFLLPLMCIVMAALPWILLSPRGRRQIGIKRTAKPRFYAIGMAAGVFGAALCFGLGMLLFGHSADNWFVSIAGSYRPQAPPGLSQLQLHLFFTVPACLFSPIGEEIFFRGFLQRVLEQHFSKRTSTAAEAGLFALVHLCHHGIAASATGFRFLPLSGALWVGLMFGLSLAFAWLRKRSDSVLPAIASHAAFNATMNAFIFAYLWR